MSIKGKSVEKKKKAALFLSLSAILTALFFW